MDLFDDGSCDPPPSGRSSTKRQRIDEAGIGINVNVNGMGSANDLALISSVSSPGTGNSVGGQGSLANLAVPKKSSRARSDSAPMGYHTNQSAASGMGLAWNTGPGGLNGAGGHGIVGRPRSGSGMMPRMGGIPNIGNMTRGNNASTPLLSITTAEAELGR